MEHEGSLLCSQEPTTSHPEPDESNSHLPPYVPKSHLNNIFPPTPWSCTWSLPSGFPDQNCACILPLPWVLHALPISPSLIWSLCCVHLQGEDRGSTVIRNVGTLPQRYMASQPRRPRLESTPNNSPERVTIQTQGLITLRYWRSRIKVKVKLL